MSHDLSPQARVILGLTAVVAALAVCALAASLLYLGGPRSAPAQTSPAAPAETRPPAVLGQTPLGPVTVGAPLIRETGPVGARLPETSPMPAPTLLSPAPYTPPPTPIPSDADIEALLGRMSLEEKVGQMILSGLNGPGYGPQAERLITVYHLAGVVYFAENTRSAAQTLRLSQQLQAAASQSGQGIPLIISIDHEGGKVFRFQDDLTHFPNFMTLGAANSPDLAAQVAAAAAQELQAVGINASFAPDLDVNREPLNPVIGVRSLGGDPQRVAQIGAAYLNGLQAAGVIGAAKHFPGHGATASDSHEELPVVNRSLDELAQIDLIPFEAAIANGVGMVMVGHIAFPQIDPSGAPASLSPIFVTQILRQDLGYEGVIVTDAMSMGALTNSYPPDQAALLAAQAGCDLLAYTSPDSAIAAYETLLAAAQQGRLPAAQVEASARRVLRLKARFGLFGELPTGGPIPLEQNRSLAYQAARQAITLVGPAAAPLVNTPSLLLVTPDVLSSGQAAGDGYSYLGDLLRQRGLQVDEWIYSTDDNGQAAAISGQVQRALPQYPLAVLVAWDARLAQRRGNPAQANLAAIIAASSTPLILVAGSSPYDLSLAPPGRPALATYGGLEVQLEALADALLSPTPPTGTLPVTLP